MEFERGEQVEVIMEDEGFKGSYYAAIIMSKKGTSRYKVEFTTLSNDIGSGPLEEVLDVDQLRPVPPQMPVTDFDLYDLADAYEQDGWWGGIIYKKLELDYLVYFPTLERALACPLEKLRIHQEWANGRWRTCTKSANKSSKQKQAENEFEEKTGKSFKKKQVKKSSKVKQAKKKNVSRPKSIAVELETGQELEAIKEEEGYEGPYNAANIISNEGPVGIKGKRRQISKKKQVKESSRGKQAKKKSIGLPNPTVTTKSIKGPSQYPLKYKTQWRKDKSRPLVEVVGDDQLRLVPPHVLANKSFKKKQPKIEPEEQKGKIFPKKQAKMNSKGEQLQIEFDVKTGKIFPRKQAKKSLKGKRADKKMLSLPEPKVTEFQVGEEVEVMLKEQGFEGSYFAAKILSKEGASQYKVEYKTLFKEDESGPLEEVVGVYQLRPSPPHFPVSYFSLYELADVYQGDGWWTGIIYGKFQSDYFVYFPSTKEEIPYPLEQLRVHQDWSDGRWISSKTAEPILELETKTKQKRMRKEPILELETKTKQKRMRKEPILELETKTKQKRMRMVKKKLDEE